MTTRMLIDARHREETRIAVVKGNRIEEFDFESAERKQLKGNIYLAKVTRVEPSLQAAFIDYGGNRHGFLAFSEIHPDYYQIPKEDRDALLREEAEHAAEEAALRADYDSDDEEGDDEDDIERFEDDGGVDPEVAEELEGAHDENGDAPRRKRKSNGDDAAVEDLRERRMNLRRRYKIQDVIHRRQVLLVQVVKEERGNKGAALTTYLSLAGRYSVLMPNTARGGGISRKITDSEDRKRLKSIAHELEVPEGMGIILRTAGASRSESEVKRDFEYLLRMWETIRELTLRSTAPSLVYEEGSLIKRAIRDLYSKEMEEVCVAGEAAYREARDFMRLLMPSHIKQVRLYGDTQPIFAKSGVEAQLDAMFSNHVTLRSGGYIVINQTEALVAIDVNSGRSTREHNIEDTALRTNLEAADEVARQLRLRDLAGLIVVDFIDMEESRNNRAVERRMKDALKNDRARIQIGRISHFGLLEMSRQRIRTGVLEGSTVLCPHCAGAGTVRSTSSIALHVLRVLEDTLIRSSDFNLIVRTRMEVALYILNQKRAHLSDLEQRFGVMITVLSDPALTGTVYHALERGDAATPPPRIASFGSPADSPSAEDDEFEPEIDGDVEEEIEGQDTAELQAPSDHRSAESDEPGGDRRRRRRRRRRGRERDERSPASVSDGEEASSETVDDFGSVISADASEDSGDLPVEAELERDLAETAYAGEMPAPADRQDVGEAPMASSQPEVGEVETDPAPTEEPRRRRSRRSAARATPTAADGGSAATETVDEGSPAPRRSRRSRSRPVEAESPTLLPFAGSEAQSPAETPASEPSAAAPATMPAGELDADASGNLEEASANAEPQAEARQDQPLSAAATDSTAAAPETAAPEPEAPPAPERPKRSGWWQRAKATLTGE